MLWVDALRLAAAFLLATVAVARLTRLITSDAYPPAVWFRSWWIRVTDGGAWSELVECPFCAAPYLTALVVGVGIAADVWTPDLASWGGWWWVLAVWASMSYLAACFVVRDEPSAED